MAESRLRNLGTVFTRIKGLIRGGAMKFEDRPLWYDVYEAFPPKLTPTAERPTVFKEIKDIMYPEDIIRAHFYKHFSSPGVINLVSPTGHTLSQKFVDTFLELAKDSRIPRNQLVQAALDEMAAQGTPLESEANVDIDYRKAGDPVYTNEREPFMPAGPFKWHKRGV
ncbi:putative 28S ribosomal protein S23, mitochondrial [Hypsibius exemplaris]|uniref:Small ribosomal subunit protein mS23 n=1 Tax=Hypsibius exemplaris TaxID=2072580 RepID=A0A1W0X4C7_HYPEX|nr:putative 28S ribosomal protein S23, mitochondrial [Hypsibius exemplaris]